MRLAESESELPVMGDWYPGDSVGIFAENPSVMVDYIIERLLSSDKNRDEILDADTPFSLVQSSLSPTDDQQTSTTTSIHQVPHIRCPTTLRNALTHHCDLTAIPKRNFLRFLADNCSDKQVFYLSPLLSSSSFFFFIVSFIFDIIHRYYNKSINIDTNTDAMRCVATY